MFLRDKLNKNKKQNFCCDKVTKNKFDLNLALIFPIMQWIAHAC